MKKLVLLLSIVAVNDALAFPFYDPFADRTASGGSSYTAGSPLATQNDGAGNVWNAVGTSFGTTEPLISAGTLSYPNVPQTSGNSVSFVGANSRGDRLNFNATITVTNTRAYYSYLLKLTDISAVPSVAASNFFAGFSDGSNGQGPQVLRTAARVVVKQSGTGYVLGMSRNNNPADNVYDTNVFNVNDTVFLVGSYDRIGGVTNVNLWINPPAATFGSNAPPTPTVSTPTVSGSFAGDINTAGGGLILGFMVLCQNATAPSGIIDELRIGTNWSYVTGGDPAFTLNPTNRLVPAGNTVTFNALARGTPTIGYQWYKDGTTPLNDGGNLSGTHSPNLTISSISGADAGSYSVFATNGLGSFAQSSSATLAILTDPLITGQPQNVTTNFGGSATFQVTATGTAPLGYQWHKQGSGDLTDGPNVTGSHTSTLTLANLSASDAANYYVTVSNSVAQVDSAMASLTVLDPYIVTQPVSVTTNSGGTASFHVVAAGSGSLSYEWLKNGNIIFFAPNISGQSSDTLTVSSVTSADAAGYSVIVFGSGSVTSSVANLTVLTPVSIVTPPSPRTVIPGVRTAFVVGPGGSGPLSYQWQFNGVNISGANSQSYVVTNAQPLVAGNYQVVVSNSFSSITSPPAALTVTSSLTLAETNLIVIRVGDGAQTQTLNGNSMYLDQYDLSGSYVNTVTVPDSGPSAMVAIGLDNLTGVNSGSTTGSGLTRSLDGRFMVIAAYGTNLTYGSSLNTSASAAVPRCIATIESHGQYTRAVADTDSTYDSAIWRAGITDGTNNYWGSANIVGTYYFGFDAPPALIQNTMVNLRSSALFNGDIYGVSAATPTGVQKINGMPKTASTPTTLFSGSTGSYDLTVSPNGNLIYLSDQRNVASGGGIQRWDFNGTSWALTYTLNTGFGNLGPRYLTADFSGANPVIYATSNDQTLDNNRIIKVIDTGSGSAGTTIANAGPNQTFRSIRFGPVANTVVARPLLSYTRSGNNLVLTWNGAFTLQSSTNVTGTYVDLPSATSPYTNSIGAEAQRYFRLHN
jgi:hypothetical protein